MGYEVKRSELGFEDAISVGINGFLYEAVLKKKYKSTLAYYESKILGYWERS